VVARIVSNVVIRDISYEIVGRRLNQTALL